MIYPQPFVLVLMPVRVASIRGYRRTLLNQLISYRLGSPGSSEHVRDSLIRLGGLGGVW